MSSSQIRLTRQLRQAMATHLAGGRPFVPGAGGLAWRWFTELSDGRSYGFSGPLPLSWADIDAWARLNRWPLERHHIDQIRALDAAWIEGAHGNSARKKRGPAPPINPAAFDAVFH